MERLLVAQACNAQRGRRIGRERFEQCAGEESCKPRDAHASWLNLPAPVRERLAWLEFVRARHSKAKDSVAWSCRLLHRSRSTRPFLAEHDEGTVPGLVEARSRLERLALTGQDDSLARSPPAPRMIVVIPTRTRLLLDGASMAVTSMDVRGVRALLRQMLAPD